MTVLGWVEDGHYLPEEGILVVRDFGVGIGDDELSASDAHPCGTIAQTGQGWLHAAGGDGPCVVRLRAHSTQPDDVDTNAWADLVEVPYRSTTGSVALTLLTTGSGENQLRLGATGMYRLRVAHRPLPMTDGAATDDTDEDEYLAPTDLWELDFWPVAGADEPPRWLRRRRPAVRPTDPGWTSLLGFQEVEVAKVVQWSGQNVGMTADDLRRWGLNHHRGETWLDQPLQASSPRSNYPSLADIAAQVGIPEPRSRRDMLRLSVALGILTFDGTRYFGVERPPMAQHVLELHPEVITFLEALQAYRQFTAYAADLLSVAQWGGTAQTLASLAARTSASEDDARRTLQYAEARGLLRVGAQSADQFTLTPVKPRRAPF